MRKLRLTCAANCEVLKAQNKKKQIFYEEHNVKNQSFNESNEMLLKHYRFAIIFSEDDGPNP
jgi:hypothetical protein